MQRTSIIIIRIVKTIPRKSLNEYGFRVLHLSLYLKQPRLENYYKMRAEKMKVKELGFNQKVVGKMKKDFSKMRSTKVLPAEFKRGLWYVRFWFEGENDNRGL